MAQIYLGLSLCNENPEEMKQVQRLLEAQKPHVKVYNSDGILERLVSGDTAAHMNWNGYSLRARKEKATLRYAYPREGTLSWFDSIAVPTGAKNYANALKFAAFMLQPQNAALQSNFAGYANGIAGSAAFMNDELKAAPEVSAPGDVKAVFSQSCPEAGDQADRPDLDQVAAVGRSASHALRPVAAGALTWHTCARARLEDRRRPAVGQPVADGGDRRHAGRRREPADADRRRPRRPRPVHFVGAGRPDAASGSTLPATSSRAGPGGADNVAGGGGGQPP